MNRTLLVVIALAAVALLVPSGATPFDPLGTDTVSENIVAEPTEGPNGGYAVINEDDEVELLLTDSNPYIDEGGVGEDTITPIHRVFTLTNTDGAAGKVWLTDDADDVRLYRGDDAGDSLEGRENAVVLGPSDSVAVGLLVDTRGDHDVESADTFTIHAEPAGDESSGGGGGDGGGGGSAGDEESTDEPTEEPTEEDTPDDEETEDGTEEEQTTDEPTETPTSTPEETESGTISGPGGGPTETRTTETTQNETSAITGGLPELGGIGLGALLWILLALLAALVALAIARRYRD